MPDSAQHRPALVAQDLMVFRGDRLVLDTLSLSLNTGEALLLTGPNGAGKSTLLRVLAGLRQPDSGALLWYGQPTRNDRAAHAGRVAYLGHQEALKPGLSVRENLSLFAAAGQLAAQLRRQDGSTDSYTSPYDLPAALAAMDLVHLADLPARLLSAGQKRRTALARVLLAQAPLWLLDEPSLGLDTAAIALLGEAMAAHRARGGLIIATTHVPLPLESPATLALPGAMDSITGNILPETHWSLASEDEENRP
ncbi:heme ABC exporter ATP-binding protein CcmA [Acetobacter papayae]|uniref:heme ABC exporter ATP-binding protein CcmA n=1 Tax=Acetobacter papayae TaxID=1076592 RepID=UPI0039ED4065